MIDPIIGGEAGPPGGEAEHAGREAENRPGFGISRTHGQLVKCAGMDEFAQDDQEDDESRDPGPVCVGMDQLIAKYRDDRGSPRNDKDTGIAWDLGVHGIEQLRTNDDVDSAPAQAGQDVKDCNCIRPHWLHSEFPNMGILHGLTDFDPVVPKEIARKHHLSKAVAWPKGREEGDRSDA